MLSAKYRGKLLARFPFLFPGEMADALESGDSETLARAEDQLLESVVRFLGGLFLRQVFVHGVSDERVTRFLDQELETLPLDRWIEFQRLVLEERHVPFEDIFSLEFKRRDLLLLINRRYLGYLASLESQVRADSSPELRRSVEASSAFADFVEFLVTYFKSDIARGGEGRLVLVNKERDEVLALYPIFLGTLEAMEVFAGFSNEGVRYFSLVTHTNRETTDAGLLSRLGESFLRVGAYRQAIATFEKMTRAGHTSQQHDSALYASHCYLGLEHYRKSRYHEAIAEFEKALEIRSDMPQLHYNLALSYARLNNFSRATQILSTLVEEHPEADRGYELLGDLFQMKGDRVAARRMYDKALMNNPRNKAVEQKRRRLSQSRPRTAATAPATVSGSSSKPAEDEAKLRELLIDLSAEAAEGRLRHIVGREPELHQMMEILCCESRSNPVLIGEPGVGKTVLVEELALRVMEGRVPAQLRDRKLYLMSVATLLAGAKFRGQFEERILGLLKELKRERCILFIDDIHTIVNSGLSKGGTLDTSNLLKPALIRGEIQAIGATSFDEYRNNIEKDPSLTRCFQLVHVEEPTPEAMIEILADHKERLATHHGVRFGDFDTTEIVRLISICLRDRRLPDAAVMVFDRAAARVCLRSPQEDTLDDPAEVLRDDVAAVIGEMSGVPVSRLSASESDRFLNMESILCERVVGQDDALKAVSRVLRTARLDMDLASYRPNGVFLFVGPTGVGKTELARTMSEFLFGEEDKMIRIDMSEYMEKISASRLIGTAPGYVGYNDQNQLTDQVRKQPYALVLLDEIEKADGQMLNLFLQVFDAGRLTDGKGRTVHFNNTTIVMTSNVGTHLYGQSRAGYAAQAPGLRDIGRNELQKEIKRYFPPEFLNRIDEVVFFRPLDTRDLKRVARLQLSSVMRRLAKQNVELRISDEVYELLITEGASVEYGARNLARTLRRRVLDPLAQLALNSPWERVRRVVLSAPGDRIEVALVLEGDVELEAVELEGSGESDLEAVE